MVQLCFSFPRHFLPLLLVTERCSPPKELGASRLAGPRMPCTAQQIVRLVFFQDLKVLKQPFNTQILEQCLRS